MKPTIGRAVHFVQRRSQYDNGVVHLPATIVAVHTSSCVNLQVLTDLGHSGDTENVKHVSSVSLDETGTIARSWHWPERQD